MNGQKVTHVFSDVRRDTQISSDYLIKYIWSAAGYALIALPVLFSPKKKVIASEYNHLAANQDDGSLNHETGDHAVANRTECTSVPRPNDPVR